jgi:hypothetical protein
MVIYTPYFMKSFRSKANVPRLHQETQYTCVSSSVQACLKALGKDVSESDVNKVVGAKSKSGASFEQAIIALQYFGARSMFVLPATLEWIKEHTDRGNPVIIGWNPEGRPWSHASVVNHVDEDFNVYVMDPNVPDPSVEYRVLTREEFHKKWLEEFNGTICRRPAIAVELEIVDSQFNPISFVASRGSMASKNKKYDPSKVQKAILRQKALEDGTFFQTGGGAHKSKNSNKVLDRKRKHKKNYESNRVLDSFLAGTPANSEGGLVTNGTDLVYKNQRVASWKGSHVVVYASGTKASDYIKSRVPKENLVAFTSRMASESEVTEVSDSAQDSLDVLDSVDLHPTDQSLKDYGYNKLANNKRLVKYLDSKRDNGFHFEINKNGFLLKGRKASVYIAKTKKGYKVISTGINRKANYNDLTSLINDAVTGTQLVNNAMKRKASDRGLKGPGLINRMAGYAPQERRASRDLRASKSFVARYTITIDHPDPYTPYFQSALKAFGVEMTSAGSSRKGITINLYADRSTLKKFLKKITTNDKMAKNLSRFIDVDESEYNYRILIKGIKEQMNDRKTYQFMLKNQVVSQIERDRGYGGSPDYYLYSKDPKSLMKVIDRFEALKSFPRGRIERLGNTRNKRVASIPSSGFKY